MHRKSPTKETIKKMKAAWDEEKVRLHSEEQKRIQKEIWQKVLDQQHRDENGKLLPHPDNDGTVYEGLPIPVTNYVTWQANYRSMGSGKVPDWEPSTDGFEPTEWAPGSVRKIMVMRERLENGQPLFHEDDATGYGEDYDHENPGARPVEWEHEQSIKCVIDRYVARVRVYEESM